MGSLLLRYPQLFQTLDAYRVISNCLGSSAARTICNTAFCCSSSSLPEVNTQQDEQQSKLLQQQQQQHPQFQDSIWDRPYQRRMVRRRPKHITDPLLQRGSTAPAYGVAGSTVYSAPSSNSSSSGANHNPTDAIAQGWGWNSSADSPAHRPRHRPAVTQPQQQQYVALDHKDQQPDQKMDNAVAAAPHLSDIPRWKSYDADTANLLYQTLRTATIGLEQHQQPATQAAAAKEPELPVHAVHMGGECDFQTFCRDYHLKDRTAQARDHAVITIDDISEERVLIGPDRQEKQEIDQVMVIYRYGSVVFFNVKQRTRENWLDKLMPYIRAPEWYDGGDISSSSSSRELTKPALRTDGTDVIIRDMPEWSLLEPDRIVVQTLDVGNIRMISHVLGQSVALAHYNAKVDEAIQNFTPYLCDVAKSGKCDYVKEARLLQLIAENSLLYTDVITKIGLLDISPTAWGNDRYCKLWESLRSDYEIEKRFDAINRKLGPMLENAKFLLDIRAEKKSADAEMIIIILICVEVILGITGFFL